MSTKLANTALKDTLQDSMSNFIRKEKWKPIIKISYSQDNKRAN